MATRGQKAKLGIFLIGALVTGGILLVTFGGFTYFRKFDDYYVLVPGSIEGLEKGAPVKLRGVRVGRVSEFDMYPKDFEGVRVSLNIEPGTRIASDARAYLKFQGLTGLKLIDILESSANAPPLPPGSRIEYGKTFVEQLSDRAETLLDQSVALMGQSERLVGRLLELANAIDVERIQSTFDVANGTLMGLRAASSELEGLLSESRTPIARTLERSEETFARADELLLRTEKTIARLDGAVLELATVIRGSDGQVQTTIYNLREASQSLKELGRELRLDPSRLIFSRPPEERELP